jgi:DNA polymerase-2
VIQGFPLTRTQRDTPAGVEYQFWLTTNDGAERVTVVGDRPLCFVKESDESKIRALLADIQGWELKPLALKDFAKSTVLGLYCQTLQCYWESVRILGDAGVALMEEDIRPIDRYLMERFIRTGAQLVQGRLGDELKACDYSPKLSMLSIDIETTLNADKILSVAMQMGSLETVLFNGEAPALGYCESCEGEADLLIKMVDRIIQWDPDLIIGWNLIGFDLRVLETRAQAHSLSLKLGRDRAPMTVEKGLNGRWFARISGRVAVDGIEALKGATWHFNRFSLEYVAQALLGRGKAIDDPYDRGEKIQTMYASDRSSLAKYNLEDCRLVTEIFEKTAVVEYLIERARLTGLPLDKVGGSQQAFDNLYLPKLHRAGYVAQPYASGRSDLSVPGGFVMESKPGLYDDVLVFDFKSLYPSIIRTFSIDPLALALADEAKETTRVAGFFEASFNSEVALLPQIIADLWQARDQAKAAGNAALSQAIKIQMNACYGVLGSNVCRFYDQRLSGAITLRGHEILQRTAQQIEQSFGHQVIYGDTDSVFVWIREKALDCSMAEHGEQIAAQVNSWLTETLAKEYGVESALELQFESHFSRFLMPTMRHSERGTKKRYAGKKVLSDGTTEMVFKGLETVRSDWTELAKTFQVELFERIFAGSPWRELVTEYVDRVLAGQVDELLVYKRRLRRELSEYVASNPPHVKAARKLQAHLKEVGIRAQLGRGDDIEYLMTVNGPEPVSIQTSAIDYNHYLDKQLRPVADTLLPFVGTSFDQLTEKQITLF